MAGINKSRATAVAERLKSEEVTNHEGAIAYKVPAKQRLIERVVGAFWNEDSYYTKGSDNAKAVVADIREVAASDPKFILQLAAYARNELNMRTTPQVLLAEAAQIETCKPFVREYTPKITKRADEIPAVLAYTIDKYGGENKKNNRIPNSLKKGLADAFANFDEYQLNKYDSDAKSITLRKALLLVDRSEGRPVSKEMANYLINDIVDEVALPKIAATKKILAKEAIDDEVKSLIGKSAITWEMFISKFGASKETWELVAPKMGYMAKLRNLRNFIEKDVDLTPILEELEKPENVRKSKQLPYRFFSAYREVDVQRVQRAIANAFENSISNVSIEGSSAVATDLSGSMQTPVSAKSKILLSEIGGVLSAIALKKSADSVAIGFGSEAKIVPVNPDDRMMTNVQKIIGANVGHATNAYLIFKALGNRKVDRVIVFSDMQCYDSYGSGSLKAEWDKYVKNVNPKAYLYSINLHSYGTAQFPSFQKNVVTLAGWSDKIIDYINLIEKRDVMESEIRSY
jgi:60 kDa SS-A/Ro ribonucleoprotein